MVLLGKRTLFAASLVAAASMMSTIVAADDRSFVHIVKGDDLPSHYDLFPVMHKNDGPKPHWLEIAQRNIPSQHHETPNPVSKPVGPPAQSKIIQIRRTSTSYGACGNNYGVNYLQLSIQWGPGFCEMSPRKCQIVKPLFTIHGMWPQVTAKKNVENCGSNSEFNMHKLDDSLRENLNKYWFSFYSYDGESFWRHEWSKHGTCARGIGGLRGLKQYFAKTISIMKSLELKETLANDNIKPGWGKGNVYPSSNIIHSLKKRTGGKEVQINCDTKDDSGVPILTGISVCLNRNLAYIDCPSKGRKCRGHIVFKA